MNVFYLYYIFFCVYGCCCFCCCCFHVYLPAVYLNISISSFFLFFNLPTVYYFTIIITTIMLINITVTGISDKSSWGEFQVRNSRSIVYPYS